MPSAFTTPPVKMRLERPAGRDKREIKIIFPLNMPRAQAEGIQNRFYCPSSASCSYSCAAPPPGYFTLTKALFRMHTPSEYTVSRNF